MTRQARLRRALLFCPGTERKKIEKAAVVPVDAVILDLEDAAAASMKAEARRVTATALAEVDFGGRERVVRVNPVGSGLEEADVAALTAGAGCPDALLLPKVEGAGHVHWAADALARVEERHRRPLGSIRLLALIETARGVTRLAEIAAAHSRLEALVFGAEDLCGDLGAIRTEAGHEVAYARSALVIHAAAERLQAIDTPFVDLNDVAGLERDTRRSLEMGYTGRLAIHPRQVQSILATFIPSADEVAAATRLLAEHARHQAAGRGVFELDGRMVDLPMIRAARAVLARARAGDG